MKCSYSININGKKVEIFSVEGNRIDSYEKLVSEIRKQAFKDPEKFEEILRLLSEANTFENITADNINDNSVGFYTPAELLNNLIKNDYERSKFRSLKIADNIRNKGIVSVGFGSDEHKTGVYGNKVYLNLNHSDLYSNQIIALTELALTQNVDNYSGNFAELVNSTKETDIELVADYIKQIIKSTKDADTISFLERKIKGAYYKSNIKSDIGSRNITASRENLEKTYELYASLLEPDPRSSDDTQKVFTKRDNNYLPRTSVKVIDLKPGDLVAIPDPEALSKGQKYTDSYEIFYDSYIDPSGEVIIRTVHKNHDNNTYYLRKRESLQSS